jgi:hypothetical protein
MSDNRGSSIRAIHLAFTLVGSFVAIGMMRMSTVEYQLID